MPRLKTSELARRLAAQRLTVDHWCAECGAAYHGVKRQVYCSQRCQTRAASRRYRAARRAGPAAGTLS